MIAGPFNFPLDLLWVSSDPYRQALRDTFAHTFVVRASARPAGNAKISYRVYMVFGWTMLFGEVEPDPYEQETGGVRPSRKMKNFRGSATPT